MTLAGRRRAPVVTAPPQPAPLPPPPPLPQDALAGNLTQLEARLRTATVPFAEQARLQSANAADFVRRLAPLVGADPAGPFKGITTGLPTHAAAWDQPNGQMVARAAWDTDTNQVHLHPEVARHLEEYVATGKLNIQRYMAVQTVVHELQHAQSRPLNKRWEYDPNIEEGFVEWRSRRLANAALFGGVTVPAGITNVRSPSYARQHDAIEIVANAVGDARMDVIWNAPSANQRRTRLNAAIKGLTTQQRRAALSGLQ
jgi:hypothetical protein